MKTPLTNLSRVYLNLILDIEDVKDFIRPDDLRSPTVA